ncbi:MAG TPA: hypothetical protein VIJ12_03235 [Candidatus Baltobacteraceae bacterium]
MLLSALILAQLVANPNPTPTPHLQTIVTVKTTNYCTALRNLAVPVGYVTRKNTEAFLALEKPIVDIVTQNRGVSSATGRELADTLNNGNDDTMTYNAGNTISMETISKITWEIDQNLALEDKVMEQSWKDYPKGKDPDVDKLRQRLQNVIDLQNALDDKYSELAQVYLDNAGDPSLTSNTAPSKGEASDNTGANQAAVKAQLRDAIYGEVSALLAANKPATITNPQAQDEVAGVAHHGNTADISRELTLQELAFSKDVVTGSQRCGIQEP